MSTLKLQILLGAVDKLTAPLKAVSGQSRITAKDLVDTKKKIRDLETQAGQIEGYKTLGAQIGATKAKLKQAEGSFSELQRKIADTPKPTRLMINELNKAEKALNQLKTKEGEMITRHAQMGEAMRKSGINTSNLSETQRRLKTDLAAANGQLDQQRAKLGQLADQQKRLNQVKASYRQTQELRGQIAGHGATALATGTAMGMTTLKPVIEFARAETSVVDLKVSMMGKGGQVRQEFQAISDLATKLGNKLPGTTADFQNMMSTLIQQGMSAKSILGGLGEATAYLGVQLKMPFDQAALFAAKLQDATGTAEQDMMGLMDTIQRSFYLGVDSGNMLGAFTKLTPALGILRKSGLEAAKVLAPLVIMADQAGMAGESSGNAYRKVFQMSMNTGKIAKATKGTGLKLNFTDGKGEFAGMENMFAQLAKLKGLNTERRLQVLKGIYGDDAETLQVLELIISKGMDGYRATQKKMADQAALQERVNAQLGTLGSLWDAATGTFTNAMVNFGEAIAPEIKAITEWIGDLSERLGNWAKRNPELSNTLMKIGGILSAVTIAFGGLSLAVAAVLGPMAIMKLTLGVLGVTFGGMLGAITAILAPLAGLAILGVAIIKFWQPISAFFSGLWQGIMAGLAPVFEAFKPFAPLIDGIGTGVKALSGWFGDLLEPLKFSKETLEGFGSAGQFVGRILGEAFNLALTPLKAFLKGIEWLLESLGILEAKKLPSFQMQAPTAATPGYLNGHYGQSAFASGYDYGTTRRIREQVMPTALRQPVEASRTIREQVVPAALRQPVEATRTIREQVVPAVLRQPSDAIRSSPRIIDTPKLAPARGGGSTQIHAPISIVQQPGQSGADVAQEVRRELDRRERQASARTRASLRDNS
ncbi:phage tail tape measure protein [Aeromonas caviae]|uniref:phage tail tape measure protein n=1 Tax=Aeromonas caviae TaxID=648 RepID=UPI000A583798|nr:phage tail tape measure protein [Aeromonas caviae]PNO60458.1 phage tail tape measure protein [Aeromonas caviae]